MHVGPVTEIHLFHLGPVTETKSRRKSKDFPANGRPYGRPYRKSIGKLFPKTKQNKTRPECRLNPYPTARLNLPCFVLFCWLAKSTIFGDSGQGFRRHSGHVLFCFGEKFSDRFPIWPAIWPAIWLAKLYLFMRGSIKPSYGLI